MYLFIRKVERKTHGTQPNNLRGDVVSYLPDDHPGAVDNFGKEASTHFRIVKVPGMTEVEAEALIEEVTDTKGVRTKARKKSINLDTLPRTKEIADINTYINGRST